jgi:RNA-binding protein YhbY
MMIKVFCFLVGGTNTQHSVVGFPAGSKALHEEVLAQVSAPLDRHEVLMVKIIVKRYLQGNACLGRW